MEDSISLETLAIALLGGFAGALVTTLIRIGHEREENHRGRLIVAADDFSVALTRALLQLDSAYKNLKEGTVPLPNAPLSRGQASMDDAHTRLGRIDLLYGDETKAGRAANDAMVNLRKACRILTAASSKEDLAGYTAAYDDAHAYHLAFCRAARRTIRPWWKRSTRHDLRLKVKRG